MTPILASLSGIFLGWTMGFLSVFLILLILIQRGKGGGLTGALGGPGGQSAFGSKAGDTFTLITVVVASIWGFTCAFTMWLLGTHAPSSTLTESTLSAGPGEAAEPPVPATLPDLDSAGDTSGGIGALAPAEQQTANDDVPSAGEPTLELTPAQPVESPPDQPAGDADAPAASDSP